MAKKPDLQAALLRSAPQPTAAETVPLMKAPRRSKQTLPTGGGKHGNRKGLTTWQPEQVHQNLRILAAQNGTSIQDLVLEALNDLFAREKMPTVRND